MSKSTLVAIRYVGPHDEVQIAATGLVAQRDEVVEVAAWLAGSVPVGDDPGAGLLAQSSNWQPATIKTPADAKPSSDPKE